MASGLMTGIMISLDQGMTDIIGHTNAVVTQDIYSLNHDNYEGFQWVAALDSSTCLICAELSNQIFLALPNMDLTDRIRAGSVAEGVVPETAPEQPIHPNCRCFMVPILEGGSDDAKKLGPDYEEWFEKQPMETQIDILGPSRFKLFEEGRAVTNFVNNQNEILTLDELGASRTTRIDLFGEVYEHKGKIKEYQYMEVEFIDDFAKNQITEQLDTLYKQYPDMREFISEVNIDNEPKKWKANAIYDQDKNSIHLLQGLVQEVGIKQKVSKWGRPQNLQYLVSHEFGHGIAMQYKKKYKENLATIFAKRVEKMTGFSWDKNALVSFSGYASSDKDEFLAEVFAFGQNPAGYNKNQAPFVELLLELLQKK